MVSPYKHNIFKETLVSLWLSLTKLRKGNPEKQGTGGWESLLLRHLHWFTLRTVVTKGRANVELLSWAISTKPSLNIQMSLVCVSIRWCVRTKKLTSQPNLSFFPPNFLYGRCEDEESSASDLNERSSSHSREDTTLIRIKQLLCVSDLQLKERMPSKSVAG